MTTRKYPTLTLAGLVAAGLVTGFAAHRLSPASSPLSPDHEADHNDRTPPGSQRRETSAASDIASFPERHSTETAESLALIPDDQLYASLALWLTDATEPQIAAFWLTYSKKENPSYDITDLIFLNWTRLDPQAAIAGSSRDHHAWWAWACHNPDAALAEASANAPDHVNHVAWGIGEFHPEWLRAHFNELSKEVRDRALSGSEKWYDGQDPLASIKFLQEIDKQINPGTFKVLVRQDPWAALDWVKENAITRESFSHGIADPIKVIIDSMAETRPDDLERLAAQTPSGQLKRQMESALFNNLLESDPDAALEKARTTTVPRTAAERYAVIGETLVKTNPEQAFAIAEDLFAACPDALSIPQMVEYPNGGGSGTSQAAKGVDDFLESLALNDPARLLELSKGLEHDKNVDSAFSIVSNRWAGRDLPSYASWVNQQDDEKWHDVGVAVIINTLRNQENYAEAAVWAIAGNQEANKWQLNNLFSNWNQTSPQEAAEWLENADLPADRKKELKSSLNH